MEHLRYDSTCSKQVKNVALKLLSRMNVQNINETTALYNFYFSTPFVDSKVKNNGVHLLSSLIIMCNNFALFFSNHMILIYVIPLPSLSHYYFEYIL